MDAIDFDTEEAAEKVVIDLAHMHMRGATEEEEIEEEEIEEEEIQSTRRVRMNDKDAKGLGKPC